MFTPERVKQNSRYAVTRLQRLALSSMAVLVLLTFLGTNLQALLWQSSSWLVGAVLPAVVVQLTNAERVELAEPALHRNSLLDEAARLKAEHMARNGYFAHYSPDGVSPWYWFKQVGYTYAHAGENLAVHFIDSDEVVEGWMNSPTHRANIVDTRYTEIGVGTAKGSYQGYDTVFVVQLFGSPALPPAVAAPAQEQSVTEPEILPEPAVVEATPTPAAPDPVPMSPATAESEPEPASEQITPAIAQPEVAPEATVPPAPVEPAVIGETSNTGEDQSLIAAETVLPASAIPEPAHVVEDVSDIPDPSAAETMTFLTTSSGLSAVSVSEQLNDASFALSVEAVATQPHRLLSFIYTILALCTVLVLAISIVHEARRHHAVQVAYGLLLLVVMSGLWYIQSTLTGGVTIL